MPENMQNGLWPTIKEELRGGFSTEVFEMWFDTLNCIEDSENLLLLGAPNDFSAIWIQDNYLDLIAENVQRITGKPVVVKVVKNERAETPRTPDAPAPSRKKASPRAGSDAQRMTNGGAAENGQLNPRNIFANFVVGPANHLAHAACMAVALAPAHAYNPLFLYGDTGLGKTHLMQAVGHHVIQNNPQSRVVYISTEKFTNDYINALQENTITRFRRRYRGVDVLLIDDIHFLSGKERIQEEFFHTFNDLFESQKQIILTSDRPVSEIPRIEHRLVSRFAWGLTADIAAPDLETRIAILRAKGRALKCEFDPGVIEFVATRVTRNIRQLEGALIKIASYSSLAGKIVDLALAEKLLHDIPQEETQQQPTIEAIQKRVVEYFQLRLSDMLSRRRPNNIAFPRQIAMYLCRTLTSRSLQEIGGAFGGRDHGTVIYACQQVDNAMQQDPTIRNTIEYLKTQIARGAK